MYEMLDLRKNTCFLFIHFKIKYMHTKDFDQSHRVHFRSWKHIWAAIGFFPSLERTRVFFYIWRPYLGRCMSVKWRSRFEKYLLYSRITILNKDFSIKLFWNEMLQLSHIVKIRKKYYDIGNKWLSKSDSLLRCTSSLFTGKMLFAFHNSSHSIIFFSYQQNYKIHLCTYSLDSFSGVSIFFFLVKRFWPLLTRVWLFPYYSTISEINSVRQILSKSTCKD